MTAPLLMMRRRMMRQVQAGGGLPDTYQQVEWIGCSGTQYIKTDYSAVKDDELVATYMLTSTAGAITKTLWSAGTGDYQFIMILNGSRTLYFKYFATGDAQSYRFASAVQNIKIKYTVHANGSCEVYNMTSDTLVTTLNSAYDQPIDGTNKLYIMQRADERTSLHRCRLYDFTITNNGTKKLELIPCYRKSDNEIGLFDTVSQTFLTNAGTGTFTIPT